MLNKYIKNFTCNQYFIYPSVDYLHYIQEVLLS